MSTSTPFGYDPSSPTGPPPSPPSGAAPSPPLGAETMVFNSTRLTYLQSTAKRNANPELDSAKNKLQSSQNFAAKTLKQAKALVGHLKKSPQLQLASSLTEFYQDPEAESEAEASEAAFAFQQASTQANASNAEAFDFYAAEVLAPLEKWLAEYKSVMSRYRTACNSQLISEYYAKKLASLKKEAEKIANTPKETQTVKDRLARNVRKQRQSQAIFDQNNSNIIAEMGVMYDARFAAFAPVVKSLVQFNDQLQSKRG